MVALFLRPDADQSDGSWLNQAASNTNLFDSVDEPTTPSDTDYIVSSTTDGDKVRLRLSDPSGGVVAPFIVRYRCKRTGTQAANLIGRLYQGTSPGTLITTFTQLAIPDTFTTYTYTLTSGEFASITDFTDLYVEFELSQQSSLKVDLNFAGGFYYDSGTVADATGALSCTRASAAYANTVAGTLTSFAANTLRITDRGLLCEDGRTNFNKPSEDFNSTDYQLINLTQDSTSNSDPAGGSTADFMKENSSSGQHTCQHLAYNAVSASPWTGSVYLKASGRGYAWLNMQSDSFASNRTILVDMSTGAIVDNYSSGSMTSVSTAVETLASGWFRLSITYTPTSGGNTYILFGPAQTASLGGSDRPSYTGDGASGVYAWGEQLEQGAFVSSYIPTTTVQVSRAADDISATGNLLTLLQAVPQSCVVDVIFNTTLSGSYWRIIGNSASAYSLTQNGSNDNQAMISDGAVNCTATFGGGQLLSTGVKIAEAQSGTARSAVGGGGTVTTDSTVTTGWPNTPKIGQGTAGGPVYGYYRRITVWNSKLADATLQGYTAP